LHASHEHLSEALFAMTAGRFARSAAVVLLSALLLIAVAPGLGNAQSRLYVVHGWVQWISGTRMQVTTDDGLSLSVDLTQVDQGTYQAFRSGDGVTIAGVVTPDRSRLMARTIWSDASIRSPVEAP
jgi:hypothetical protein